VYLEGRLDYPFCQSKWQRVSTNPLRLEDGCLLVLLGYNSPITKLYFCIYVVGWGAKICKQPTEIMIPEWNGLIQNSFSLCPSPNLINEYRYYVHRRNPSFIDRKSYEILFAFKFVLDVPGIVIKVVILFAILSHNRKTRSVIIRGKQMMLHICEFNSGTLIFS